MEDHKPVAPKKPKLVRVARTPICEDPACPNRSQHLAIEIFDEEFIPYKAIAISYTWGDFDRKKVQIGHVKGESGREIWIELGKEWLPKEEGNLSDLQKRLVSLSSEKPIWLDQLCIAPKDEAIRSALADIPTIYSTFEVAILMPGNVCKCLGEFLEEIRVPNDLGENSVSTVDSELISRAIKKYQDCLNFTGSSTWFGRLWPRQELMHSRRIRCVWASKYLSECVQPPYLDQAVEHLGPHSALVHERYMKQGYSSKDAFMRLLLEQRHLAGYAHGELSFYLWGNQQERDQIISPAYYELLGGKVLENGRRTSDSLDNFLTDLTCIVRNSLLNRQTRKATKDHAYVLSVWVDCPEYRAPEYKVPKGNYKALRDPEKTMGNDEALENPKTTRGNNEALKDRDKTMGEFLQDALDQLARNHNIGILTTAPQGLFDSTSSRSALWYPKQYFESMEIRDLRDVYGPIVQDSSYFDLIDATNANVPIAILRDEDAPQSLSKTAKDFDAFFQDPQHETAAPGASLRLATSKMIEDLRQIVRDWSEESRALIRTQFFSTVPDLIMEWSSGYYPEGVPLDSDVSRNKVHPWALMAKLFDCPLGDPVISHIYRRPQGFLEEMQWEVQCVKDTVYEMMAVALRLNVQVCRKNNVGIMLSKIDEDGEAKRLGFYRGGDKKLLQIAEAEDVGIVRSVAMSLESSYDDQ